MGSRTWGQGWGKKLNWHVDPLSQPCCEPSRAGAALPSCLKSGWREQLSYHCSLASGWAQAVPRKVVLPRMESNSTVVPPSSNWTEHQHQWALPAASRVYPSSQKQGFWAETEPPTAACGATLEWSARKIATEPCDHPHASKFYCYPRSPEVQGGSNDWNSPSLCGLRMFLKEAQPPPCSPVLWGVSTVVSHFEAPRDRGRKLLWIKPRKPDLRVKNCLRTSKDAPWLGMGLCNS